VGGVGPTGESSGPYNIRRPSIKVDRCDSNWCHGSNTATISSKKKDTVLADLCEIEFRKSKRQARHFTSTMRAGTGSFDGASTWVGKSEQLACGVR